MPPSELDHTFTALSDPTRRGVIDLLRRGPRRAGELAESLEMTPPAMTRHLRVLRQSGLVEEETSEEDARVRVYTLRKGPFESLRRWLDDVEAFWSLELASFKEYAERTRRPNAAPSPTPPTPPTRPTPPAPPPPVTRGPK